mgnify:CR=1 FL=1
MQNGNSFVLRMVMQCSGWVAQGNAMRISIKFSSYSPGPGRTSVLILFWELVSSKSEQLGQNFLSSIPWLPCCRLQKSGGASGTGLVIIWGHFCINPSSEYGKSIITSILAVLCSSYLSSSSFSREKQNHKLDDVTENVNMVQEPSQWIAQRIDKHNISAVYLLTGTCHTTVNERTHCAILGPL